MDGTPIAFQIHMDELNAQIDDGAVDESLETPTAAFVRRAETTSAAAGAREGLAALEKVGADAMAKHQAPTEWNPWHERLITYPEVHSQPVEAGPFDFLLEKRARMKPIEGLTYTKRTDENGTVWREGRDASGELKSAMVVLDESEE